MLSLQVYLVVGGYDGNEFLSSTEQYSPGDSRWRESSALPQPLKGARAAAMAGYVYLTGWIRTLEYPGLFIMVITGGFANDYDETNGIYEFDPRTGQWELVDRMKKERALHGISVITYSEVERYCSTIAK